MTDSATAASATADWTTGEPRLLAYRCDQRHSWYLPRVRCPECGGAATPFEPRASGTVFAQTSLHRRVATATGATKEAVGIALVDLDDGIRLMARCRPGTPIGTRVDVTVGVDEGSQRLLPQCVEVSA